MEVSSSLFPRRCSFKLGQKISDIDQVIVRNRLGDIEKPEYLSIPHRVVDIIAFLAAHHKIPAAQNAELLGKVTLLNVQARAKFVYSNLTFAQGIQDSYAQGVGECFEKFSLELA